MIVSESYEVFEARIKFHSLSPVIFGAASKSQGKYKTLRQAKKRISALKKKYRLDQKPAKVLSNPPRPFENMAELDSLHGIYLYVIRTETSTAPVRL